jgi:zinc protease
MVKKIEDIDYVRGEVYRTLEEFKTEGVAEKKLNDLKRRNKYRFLMGLDTPDNVAGRLARLVAVTGGIEIVDELYTQFDKVTPKQIMSAAKKYFAPERRTVVVLKGDQ